MSVEVTYSVFEAVGISVIFPTQVYEEMRCPGSVLGGHVPHDAEGIAGHLTDLDVARCTQTSLHVVICCNKKEEQDESRMESNFAQLEHNSNYN